MLSSQKESANSMMNYHQDEVFHLFNHDMKAPAQPMSIEVSQSHLSFA